VDPGDYGGLLADLEAGGGGLSLARRFGLAARAFGYVARYDAAIAAYLAAQDPAEVARLYRFGGGGA
jgi:AICAR transformylase/IMP cyclohydrolase PurH